MSAESAILAARRLAESVMVDAGELRAPDTRVWNEATSQYTVTPGGLKYAGKCLLRATDTIGRDVDLDRAVMVTRFEVLLLVDVPAAAVDDVFRPTMSGLDPQLVGRQFRVAALTHGTYLPYRRLAVEEIQS